MNSTPSETSVEASSDTAANETPPLRLEYVDADSLADNPTNWRSHPSAQAAALKDVMGEVGWAGALLYNERTQRLLDGHLRKKVRAGEKVPVLIGSWTEEQEKKILATLDPIGAMAEAKKDVLETLLQGMEPSSGAVAELLEELARSNGIINIGSDAGLTDPDDVPDPPDAAITQPGDLWILGNHRLLCADSSKPEDVDRLLEGQPIHLIFSDPPYNVKVEPRSNNAISAGLSSFAGTTHHQGLDVARHPEKARATHKKLRAKDRPLANDFVTDEEFDRLLDAWFKNMARVLLPGRAFYLWGGFSNISNYPQALKANGLYFSQTIIWDKQHPVLTRKDFMGAHEWAYYGWKEGAAHQFYGPNNATDLWSVKKVNPQSMCHLTEKPVELGSRAMQYSSQLGENVLDLFGGSGSSLLAGEVQGRNTFLMEIDALYCDIIVTRWEQFTGRKAERVAKDAS